MKRLDNCVQGQGHSDGSKRHWMFAIFTTDLFATELGVLMYHT